MTDFINNALAREHQATMLADSAYRRSVRSTRSTHAGPRSTYRGLRTIGHPIAALHTWRGTGEI